MKDIDKLWALQALEMEKKEMEEDAGLYRETDKLHHDISEYKRIAESMKQIADEYKRTSTQISELQEALERIKKQIQEGESYLYEGAVKKTKTLTVLQDDIAGLMAKKEEVEKRIHHYLHQQKIDQVNLKRLGDKAEEMKKGVSQQKKKLEKLKRQTKDSMSELTKKTEKLKKSIDKESLEEYEKRANKRMPVIVQAHNGICKGCNMQVSMIMGQDISKVVVSEAIVCENCGRIIYIPGENESE
ncbi:hypothetical protein J0B03_01985 [Alkalibacter rhizosphaerae]|uniref:C4-type zinc ribbon domain-containing protein n=1 Tax=Alkalibacter rhizosphaerae TaxID=2815577 RepID=A0A974XFI5_9FIRM|nr:hypothetical protein [Alkalibacter rhizosphaerae]QSX08878.1 hypothetical protein J0B03_01985 [Alkalibacter rhizosphaerae]